MFKYNISLYKFGSVKFKHTIIVKIEDQWLKAHEKSIVHDSRPLKAHKISTQKNPIKDPWFKIEDL